MSCHAQVSRLQVAELVAATLTNPELSLNKCFELVAEEGVPDVPLPQLLEALPSEITKVRGRARKLVDQQYPCAHDDTVHVLLAWQLPARCVVTAAKIALLLLVAHGCCSAGGAGGCSSGGG